MKASNVIFLSSKIFVSILLVLSVLRELPLPTHLLWTTVGLSPVLHNHSIVSGGAVVLEISLLAVLWIRTNRILAYGIASCVAGIGLVVACVFLILSYQSSCALLPQFIRPEAVLGQKVLFAAALAVSIRGSYREA